MMHNDRSGVSCLIGMIDRLQTEDLLFEKDHSAYKIKIGCRKEQEMRDALREHFRLCPAAIPKKIHQIWIGPYPPPWKWIDSFRKAFTTAFPDWEYFLWREEDIAGLDLVNRDLYEKEQYPAGKADILRYELLYRYGGIYIDADAQWLNGKPLDELLERTGPTGLFAGREDERMVANGVIGCSPLNPLMYYVIRRLRLTFPYTRWECGYPSWIASGPLFFSDVVLSHDITVFPTHYFYPASWLQDLSGIDTSIFKDSYMIQYGYSTNQLFRHIHQ
ncbi:MAG: hypothetical protein JST68_30825 [Bacteroidetes bacterium]|nr:hypothetical protein [Bacteroidota bacterium]